MKCVFLFTLLLTKAYAAQTNPVSKVVQLLGSLEAKITKDGEAEQAAYEEYAAWCKDGAKDLNYEIKTAEGDIEDLQATISKADADTAAASSMIEELSADTQQNNQELEEATAIREKEAAEFKTAETELKDAIDTLDRAINVLEKKLRGSAFLQENVDTSDVDKLLHTISMVIDAASMSLHDKKTVLAFAQDSAEQSEDATADEMGAPAADAYKSKSGSIIEVLEDMRAKAAGQLQKLQGEETKAKHEFQMLKQSLEDQMSADAKEIDQSKATVNAAAATKATASGELATTEEHLATAEKTLADMSTGCKAAVVDHEASVKSREEELKALSAAKKALSENTGGATDAVYSASFLQIANSQTVSTHADLVNIEVVNILRELARKDKSSALAQLASRVSSTVRFGSRAGADPFTKIKGMISEMISRLEKEGAEEADHKAWCDEQMGETKQKTMELKHDIEVQTAKIDKAKSKSIKLKDEVAGLQSALADLAKSQAELDQVRKAENKVYLATKADLEQGLKGVRMAIKVLKDYYASSAALVQQPKLEAGHKKASGAGSSILGMLDVIQSDFGKSLATAEAEEDASAVEYEKVSMGNRMNKLQWEKDVEYKTKESKALDKAVVEVSSDRDSAQSELDAVLEYSKSVVGSCELKPETFEDRKSRRTDEISGLKQALEILEGQAVLLQQKSVFLHKGHH